jgi:hypothetical protein
MNSRIESRYRKAAWRVHKTTNYNNFLKYDRVISMATRNVPTVVEPEEWVACR